MNKIEFKQFLNIANRLQFRLMRQLLYILIFTLLPIQAIAQILEGRVIDTSGNPLNAVTIIVPELNLNVISSKDGRFHFTTDKDQHPLLLRKPEYKEVQYTMSGTDSIFVMEKDSLILDITDAEINTKANSIIKDLIFRAPAYSNAIKQYKSSSYIAGRLTLERIHSLIDKITYRLDNFLVSEYKDKAIFQELYTQTDYTYPDTYEVLVYGRSGNIPAHIAEKGVIEIQRGSIYANRFGKFISPLSRYAFSFYRYKYAGYYNSGNSILHKIQIISKVKDPELLNGYLYIDGTTRSVSYAILKSNEQGMEVTTSIAYNPLIEKIPLPASYYSDIVLDVIGVDGYANYYTSIKYAEIDSKEITANYNKNATNKIIIDKDAEIRDKAFWNKYRTQPFDKEFLIPDSLGKKEIDISSHWLGKIAAGGYFYGNNKSKVSVKYNGLKFVFRDYNYVDGFWLGNQFDFKYKINNKKNLKANSYIYYATARKRLLGGSDITYGYNKKRKGELTLSVGSRSEDFNNLSLTRYQNYFTSLVFGENYNFFYQRDFATISNSIHANKKVVVTAALGIEKRSGLSNHTDFSILGMKHAKPNILPNDRFDRTFYSIGLFYSPNSDYSITEAVDMHMKKVTPVFNIEYQEGFSSWQTNNSKYRRLRGGVSHNIQLNYFNWLDYKVESGVFLNGGSDMHFTDYQHFGSSDMLLNLNSLFDSFLLLDNYEIQTNKYWINLFLNYSGKYVLLKRMPFLQGKPFTENMHLKTLFTPDIKSYIETGYSLSFNRYFGIGAFTSFHNAKLKNVGIRFSFNLRSLKFN